MSENVIYVIVGGSYTSCDHLFATTELDKASEVLKEIQDLQVDVLRWSRELFRRFKADTCQMSQEDVKEYDELGRRFYGFLEASYPQYREVLCFLDSPRYRISIEKIQRI